MTLDEIRELIRLVSETGISELEVQRGDNRVRIRQSTPVSETNVLLPNAQPPATANPAAPPQPAQPAPASVPASAAPQQNENTIYVKSPIVGTFYESPSPGAQPFVRIGEQVTPGQVLCIIESMKLMNEIEADIAGVIESKLVQSGQPVEYGEALFGIRPV